MRVLMTADPIGGVASYAMELCAALAPQGVEIVLATLGGPMPPALRRELEAAGNVSIHESRFRLEWMPDPWVDLARAGDWLLELATRTCADLVHLNHLAHGDLPWERPVLVVGHSCVVSWWAAVHGCEPPGAWSRYRERVTRSLRAADAVAAPTRAMLRELRRHYGPLPRGRVVPNARAPDRFWTARKEPVILTAGRLWDEAKNLATLAAAAPGVYWPIVAAGAAELEVGTPDVAPSLPPSLAEHGRAVQWLGPLDPRDLADWYARAAIYALPARYEPFGLTALEAALSGCALVLGDIASLREVWGDAARYVAPSDPQALREVLNELGADPAQRAALAARARERAEDYRPQRMGAGYVEMYRELLEAPTHAVPRPLAEEYPA